MKKTLLIIAFMAQTFGLAAQDYTPKYSLISNPSFPTADLAVATYNVLDYGVDNTGTNDCTRAVQTLLNHLQSDREDGYYISNGGVVYMPAGKYLFKGTLTIPRGVTLRGDWKAPDNGVSGTILMVEGNEGSSDIASSFITMEPSSEVCYLSIWYPNQQGTTVYPPTVLYGKNGYFGNEYCNVRHVTLVNPYIGIKFNDQNGGGCPNIYDVYGTPLHQGVVMDAIVDVGRFDRISFSPSVWAGSGLANSPSRQAVRDITYNNATGFSMRRNDWSYTCNYTCNGYNVGFKAESSGSENHGATGTPNGHNYNFNLTDCHTGIEVDALAGCGAMFTRVNESGCVYGVMMKGGSGPALFHTCNLQGSNACILMDNKFGSTVMIQKSHGDGRVLALGGQLIADDNVFTSDVTVNSMARTVYTGNVTGGSFDNHSIFECKVSDKSAADIPDMPEYKDEWMREKTCRPAKDNLFVVTDSRFGAVPLTTMSATKNISSAPDCTAAIQKALDEASQAGGGIVYLPTGHYKISGHLTIPSGVELKGSSDVPTVPKGNGAVLEAMESGVNTPLIAMSESSGLRGVTINYPLQDNPSTVKAYPWAVRGNKNVYIVNVAMRAAYYGVDLFTNDCTGHYVDYLAGHAFKTVVRVGGGCKGGIISNIQFNTIAYACGNESKFGCWPNSNASNNAACYSQNKKSLVFLDMRNCKDEVLYNNFLFGCYQGLLFQNDGGAPTDVHALGNAIDGALNPIVVNKLGSRLDLVNSQVVALDESSSPATFYTLGANVNQPVNVFSSCNWGNGSRFVNCAGMNGSGFNMFLASMEQAGSVYTFKTRNDYSRINVVNGIFQRNVKFVDTPGSDEKRVSVTSSVVTPQGDASEDDFKAYDNNLPVVWQTTASNIFMSRSGWTASASNNNGNANNAIDGDADTRWDTANRQAAGQWWKVDFGKTMTFNVLVFDATPSPDDGPGDYKIEAYDNGKWTEVATGQNAGSLLLVPFDEPLTASQVRITLNSSGGKGGYWSIHEFNIAKVTVITGVKDLSVNSSPEAFVEVYGVNGMKVFGGKRKTLTEHRLPAGIYVVRSKASDGSVTTKKILIR